MKFVTKLFGEVDIDESKMLTFDEGIIGYPHMQHFFMIHDAEQEKRREISWMQSVEEPAFALPVINPLVVEPNYDPSVEDELFHQLGECGADGYLVLTTLRVPSDITQMSINLRAPLIINPQTRKCRQVIVEDERYSVRFPAYDVLKKKGEKEGE